MVLPTGVTSRIQLPLGLADDKSMFQGLGAKTCIPSCRHLRGSLPETRFEAVLAEPELKISGVEQ